MIVVYVFAALVLLRVVLIAVGAALIVREVHACPACFNESVPVQRPMLRFFLPWIEWRWCTYCGWEGPSRVNGGTQAELQRRADHRIG